MENLVFNFLKKLKIVKLNKNTTENLIFKYLFIFYFYIFIFFIFGGLK